MYMTAFGVIHDDVSNWTAIANLGLLGLSLWIVCTTSLI